MPACSSPRLRVIIGSLSILAYQILYYTVSSSLWRVPQGLSNALASITGIYILSLASASVVYLFSSRLHSPLIGFLIVLSTTQIAMLAGGGSYMYMLPALAGMIALVLPVIRGPPGDSVLEYIVARQVFRPVPIASSLLVSYIVLWVTGIFSYGSNYGYIIHVSGGLIAAGVQSRASRSLRESLARGALSGLGPAGGVLTLLDIPFRPLPPLKCSGVKLGVLYGYTHASTKPRMLYRIPGRGDFAGIACSKGEAILNVKEPLLIWLYSSTPVDDSLSITSGGRLLLDLVDEGPPVEGVEEEASNAMTIARGGGVGILRLGSIEAVESRYSLAASILGWGHGVGWLILRVPPERLDMLQKLLYGLQGYKRIVIAMDTIAWKGALAPSPSKYSTGVVVSRIPDPGAQEYIARALLGSAAGVDLLRWIASERLMIAYPYCNGGLLVFKPRLQS